MTVTSIVVGTDGSATAQAAIAWAADVAAAVRARVTVVHAFDPLDMLGKVEPPVDLKQIEAERQRELDEVWCAPLRQAGVSYSPQILHGDPADAVLDVAREVGADLIVVGARGHSALRDLVLGSTSNAITHRSRNPVVIIPSA